MSGLPEAMMNSDKMKEILVDATRSYHAQSRGDDWYALLLMSFIISLMEKLEEQCASGQ